MSEDTLASQSSKFRLVAFDVDGTILQGLDFSWSLIWNWLNYPKDLQNQGFNRYMAGEYTYAQWCYWACDFFVKAGLTRNDFTKLANSITVAHNFTETVQTLKKSGLTLAIVSGGIDTLLYEKIPEDIHYFDYIFINKFVFGNGGALSGVIPTQYDFEGKASAIQVICQEKGFSMEECVFVGDAINDRDALKSVGLGIAYLSKDADIHLYSGNQIEVDDLSLILPLIIQRCSI